MYVLVLVPLAVDIHLETVREGTLHLPPPPTTHPTHLQSFPSAGKMYTDTRHNSRSVLQTERRQKEAVGRGRCACEEKGDSDLE